MFQRLGVIFLASAVFAANAFCACATLGDLTGRLARDVGSTAHACCRGRGTSVPAAPHAPGRDAGGCNHCRASVAATPAQAKTTLPVAHASFVGFPSLAPAAFALEAASPGHSPDHAGLSPPVPPPTLLNQFCSFNN